MKRITIRDLRQRWPEAEKALEAEQEMLITRDGRPVAKLVRVEAEAEKRPRWDPAAHLRWLKSIWGEKVFTSTDAALARSRADKWEEDGQ